MCYNSQIHQPFLKVINVDIDALFLTSLLIENIFSLTAAMEKQGVGRLQENSWELNGNTSEYAWIKPQERQPHP